MYCCNVERAHFYVFSSKRSVLIEISRDDAFLWEVVPKLEEKYFSIIFSKLNVQGEK